MKEKKFLEGIPLSLSPILSTHKLVKSLLKLRKSIFIYLDDGMVQSSFPFFWFCFTFNENILSLNTKLSLHHCYHSSFMHFLHFYLK